MNDRAFAAYASLSRVLDTYLSNYEVVCESDATRSPTDDELAILQDAIAGLLADPEVLPALQTWLDAKFP